MQKTKAEIIAARHQGCSYTPQQLEGMLAARFPNDPIDLPALVDAWLADATLTAPVLRQCAYLIASAGDVDADVRAEAFRTRDPRDALALLRAEV